MYRRLDSENASTSAVLFKLERLEFWVAPLLGGSPRRLGDLIATHRDWMTSGTGFPTTRRYGWWVEQQSAAGRRLSDDICFREAILCEEVAVLFNSEGGAADQLERQVARATNARAVGFSHDEQFAPGLEDAQDFAKGSGTVRLVIVCLEGRRKIK